MLADRAGVGCCCSGLSDCGLSKGLVTVTDLTVSPVRSSWRAEVGTETCTCTCTQGPGEDAAACTGQGCLPSGGCAASHTHTVPQHAMKDMPAALALQGAVLLAIFMLPTEVYAPILLGCWCHSRQVPP